MYNGLFSSTWAHPSNNSADSVWLPLLPQWVSFRYMALSVWYPSCHPPIVTHSCSGILYMRCMYILPWDWIGEVAFDDSLLRYCHHCDGYNKNPNNQRTDDLTSNLFRFCFESETNVLSFLPNCETLFCCRFVNARNCLILNVFG